MSTTNIATLLFGRELGNPYTRKTSCTVRERERGMQEWVTNEVSRHCLGECCVLNNIPRSTIAATINKEGTLIASTQYIFSKSHFILDLTYSGDHTVKLVNFQTGEFVKELAGHRRTPWTVKFHPLYSNLLVSGSLDYEIKLWDTDLGVCVQSKDFGRQISSVSFHPSGKALAIAAGHKLHLWEFNDEEGKFDRSSVIFRTTRTIRTVHFSPSGGDTIMVSERVEPPTLPETPPNTARSSAEFIPTMQQPVHVPWNEFPREAWSNSGMPGMPSVPRGFNLRFPQFTLPEYRGRAHVSDSGRQNAMPSSLLPLSSAAPESRTSDSLRYLGPFHPYPSTEILPTVQQAGPSDDSMHQMPDLQQTSQPQGFSGGLSSARIRNNHPRPLQLTHHQPVPVLSLLPVNSNAEPVRTGQPNELPGAPMIWNQPSNAMLSVPPVSGNNDMPHVTKLVLYKFNIHQPHTPLCEEELKIENAVICSEMGAHISPCGRMMVVCVASPSLDRRTPGLPAFVYELRVISLEKQTFGEVLRSRAISAGHCLTSVQFSPGSDMILLSYGRKHASLLRCLELNGTTVAQIHTLLELYSAKTLALVRVMHSPEDEANTASFHPFAGEGIVYGTKNGKLRILRHKRTPSAGDGGESKYENELLEVLEDELE